MILVAPQQPDWLKNIKALDFQFSFIFIAVLKGLVVGGHNAYQVNLS